LDWFGGLEPLLARVIDLFQDAPTLRLAVPPGCARGAPTPASRIAKDAIVLDVKLVLVVVLVEVVPAGFAVVANVLVVAAGWEAAKVALLELGPVLGRVGRIVTFVFQGVEKIKGGLVLEGTQGSLKGGVFLHCCCCLRKWIN
jgi:hypothetical protein